MIRVLQLLTATELGVSSALPVLSHVATSVLGPFTMQPAAPAFCVSAPVVVSRSNAATASLLPEVT